MFIKTILIDKHEKKNHHFPPLAGVTTRPLHYRLNPGNQSPLFPY